MMVECQDCRYCSKDDISSTRSDLRKGNDTRYFFDYYNRMVYENDTCKNGEKR